MLRAFAGAQEGAARKKVVALLQRHLDGFQPNDTAMGVALGGQAPAANGSSMAVAAGGEITPVSSTVAERDAAWLVQFERALLSTQIRALLRLDGHALQANSVVPGQEQQ